MTSVTVIPRTHTLKVESGREFVLHPLDAFDYVELDEQGHITKDPGKQMTVRGILTTLWMSAKKEANGLEFEDFARSIEMRELLSDGPITEAAQFLFSSVPFTDSPTDTSTG